MNCIVKKYSVTYEDGPCAFNIKTIEVESTSEQKARELVKKKFPSAMIGSVSERPAADNIVIPRATLQQVLEAMQLLQNAIYNIGGEHVTGLGEANDSAESAEKPIEALCAALAEQPAEQEPVRGEWQGYTWNPYAVSQPKAEPLTDDAERYRWLFSAHTDESLAEAAKTGEQPEVTPQDIAMGQLSAWYYTKQQADEIIDKSRSKA